MKKSEMIQYLAELLEPVIYDRFNAHIEAEYILMKLQEEGMLPPTAYLNALKVQDNGWEPEDIK
jgi:hypothetical protein